MLDFGSFGDNATEMSSDFVPGDLECFDAREMLQSYWTLLAIMFYINRHTIQRDTFNPMDYSRGDVLFDALTGHCSYRDVSPPSVVLLLLEMNGKAGSIQ